jgi:hypothetical protein
MIIYKEINTIPKFSKEMSGKPDLTTKTSESILFYQTPNKKSLDQTSSLIRKNVGATLVVALLI